jgi:hypothetical protein
VNTQSDAAQHSAPRWDGMYSKIAAITSLPRPIFGTNYPIELVRPHCHHVPRVQPIVLATENVLEPSLTYYSTTVDRVICK